MGCTTADILACFNLIYIFLRFVCALSNSKRSVLDTLTKRISVSTLPNNPLKFAISDCVLVDIFASHVPKDDD